MGERELNTFAEWGILRLPGFLPAERVARAQQAARDRLARVGLWRDGAWHPEVIPWSEQPNAGHALVTGLKTRAVIGELLGDEVTAGVAALLHGEPFFPMAEPQVLFTLPNATQWRLPSTLWHLDLPRLPDGGIPGVQLFTFLEPVAPGGGATLVVAGSHRLANGRRRVRSQEVKKRLQRDPYFQALLHDDGSDRDWFLREPGQVGDIPVQVIELCGEPGDLYFTDLRLLHTIAPNASSVPRIMMTQRFLLEARRTELYGES